MTESSSELPLETRRRFARTEELFSRSISLWDDLERLLQSSPYTIDQWTEIAKNIEGFNGVYFPAYLQAVKSLLEHSKARRPFERPRYAHFNTIPPSRLIKRV